MPDLAVPGRACRAIPSHTMPRPACQAEPCHTLTYPAEPSQACPASPKRAMPEHAVPAELDCDRTTSAARDQIRELDHVLPAPLELFPLTLHLPQQQRFLDRVREDFLGRDVRTDRPGSHREVRPNRAFLPVDWTHVPDLHPPDQLRCSDEQVLLGVCVLV